MEFDPTLSPMRIVPQLTEKASPRPEPPSSCLDLSDVDLDIKDAASSFQQHDGSQPVMVYDASEPVRDSPDSCEMSLSVGVEASPARVVCHTSSRLDKFRNSPRPALSPLAVTVSSAQKGGSNFKPDRLSRTLFPDEDEDRQTEDEDEEIRSRKTVNGPELHISYQSRGIIEQILAHEIGHSNISKVSLNSQSYSPEAQKSLTRQAPSSVFSTSTSSQSKDFDESSSFKPKQKSTDDCDDAGSVSETCSIDEFSGPKIIPSNKHSATSLPSETVEPAHRPNSGNEPPTGVKQKKKGARQVASRYMQSAINRKANVANSSQNSNKSVATSTNTNALVTPTKSKNASMKASNISGKVPEKTIINRKESRPQPASLAKSRAGKSGKLKTGLTIRHGGQDPRNLKNSNKSPEPLTVRGEAVGGGNGNEVKASTPVGDQPFAMSYIDASAIQSITSMLGNSTAMQFDMEESMANANGSKGDKAGETGKIMKIPESSARGAGDGGEGHKITQFDLDLAYARYLQWQFLVGRARQAFHNQQQQACAQLHGLWNLTQARRQEVAQLEMDVSRLRSMTLLDEVLDKTEPELAPLVDNLSTVSTEYSQMAAALDSTCHQLPVTDIHLPTGGEPAREAMEERIAETLAKAEHLLSEINATGKRDGEDWQQQISQYVTCLAAVEKTSGATMEELQLCRRGLEDAQTLNTRLASLRVQDNQSTL